MVEAAQSASVHEYGTFFGTNHTGDQVQERCLPAAARPQQRDTLATTDGERDRLQRGRLSVAFGDVFQNEHCVWTLARDHLSVFHAYWMILAWRATDSIAL